MISVILYGRNDAHGYNLHRRVALSLNCLAEVLTDPADEIVFVDYNTPDELPTVVEALADTLTERCLGLLRVLRVPASLHTERYGGRTHLAVAEPVARNAAARRANPSNRWLLSTNTDMIFLPLQGESLSEVCGGLPDGFYALPRFELPEWVWERIPRTDPRRALAELEHLGPSLHLDEPTLGHKWVRFDAPGDFQLVLREDFLAVDGFDEEMLLGWHVDSNLSRRMFLHRGSIETLEDHIAGYHCDHSRIATVYHGGERVENDLDRFYLSVDRATLRAQTATWGLADATLEEVSLQRRIGPAFVDALLATLPIASRPRRSSDGFEAFYDSAHVLPFIADSLVVSPVTTIGYFGINPILRQMLAGLVEELGLGCSVTVAELADPNDVEELAHFADLFVVDFGTDLSLVEASNVSRFDDESAHLPVGLDLVFAALERLVEVERARLGLGAHPRRIVLVNCSKGFLDAYASAEFNCTSTSSHCRVRRATIRALPDDDVLMSALVRARAFTLWALRRNGEYSVLRPAPGKPLRFADLDDYSVRAAGWTFPDESGVWTRGPRSELSIAFPPVDDSDFSLEFLIDDVCIAPDEALTIELLVDGVRIARRDLSQPDPHFAWRVQIPPRMLTAGNTNVTIMVDEPRSPLAVGWSSDVRPLGLHLRSLTLGEVDRSVRPRQSVVFAAGTDGDRLLAEGWSWPEATGVWTDGDRACLVLELRAESLSEAVLVLDVVPFVTPEHAELTVEVWALDTRLVRRVYRHGDDLDGRLVLRLPPSVRDERGRTVLEFRLDEPARPVDLGLGSDPRRLGLHLSSLTLDGRLTVRTGETTGFAELIDFNGFGDGWARCQDEGIWTRGHCSDLALALEGISDAEYRLVLSVEGVNPTFEDGRNLELLVNGALVSVRPLASSDCVFIWRVDLPARVVADGEATLTFATPECQSTVSLRPNEDGGELGIRIGAIRLEEVDRALWVDQAVSFIDGSDAVRLLGDGWSGLEPTGVWTIGRRARIIFQLPAEAGDDLELVLGGDAYVAPGHPELEVVFTARGERLGRRLFRHGDKSRALPIPLAGAADTQGRVVIDLEIDNPASPRELGTSSDSRHLGLHVKWLMVRRTGARGHWDALQRRLRRADPRRRAREAMSTIGTSASTLSSRR